MLVQFFVGVASARAQTYAYVVGQQNEPGSGTQILSVVRTDTNSIVESIPLGLACYCINPDGIAISPDGSRVYVTNELSNTVSVIDTNSRAVVATITVGSGPTAVAMAPNGARLFVLNGSGSTSVSVVNTATNAVINTIPLLVTQARGLGIAPNGARLYVSTYSSNSVKVIDTQTNAILATIPVGLTPVGVDVAPDGARVYVPGFSSNTVE